MYHVSEPIGALEQGPLLSHEPTTKRALVVPKGQSITIAYHILIREKII